MNLRNLQRYAISKDFFERYRSDNGNDNGSGSGLAMKGNSSHKSIKSNPTKKTSTSQNNKDIYNSLFWTLYALLNNEHITSMIENHKFKVKTDFSIKTVEQLKNNKALLKEHKLKYNEIEASLMYSKEISLVTLKAIILLNKLNVIYIWNNKYYIFESNDDDLFHVIKRDRERYTFERDLAKDAIIKTYASDKLLMDDIRTQLKAVSSYKLNDLKIMAETLGISLETKKTKQQLYEEINSKID